MDDKSRRFCQYCGAAFTGKTPGTARKSCWRHQQDCKAVTVHRTTASAALGAPAKAEVKYEARNEAKAEVKYEARDEAKAGAQAEAVAAEEVVPVGDAYAVGAQAMMVAKREDNPAEEDLVFDDLVLPLDGDGWLNPEMLDWWVELPPIPLPLPDLAPFSLPPPSPRSSTERQSMATTILVAQSMVPLLSEVQFLQVMSPVASRLSHDQLLGFYDVYKPKNSSVADPTTSPVNPIWID